MGLDNVNKTCVAGFMLVSSALGGCASGMQETPYTGTNPNPPLYNPSYDQTIESPYRTLSYADQMLDHFFRMNPEGSAGRAELARIVQENTSDVLVPTTQYYYNDRGELSRQAIRRAPVWSPQDNAPLKVTREGGYYYLAHPEGDFPALLALRQGRIYNPAASTRPRRPVEQQLCSTSGRASIENNEQRIGSLESISPREAYNILLAQTFMAYEAVDRYAQNYYEYGELPQDTVISYEIGRSTDIYSCVKRPGSDYRVQSGIVTSANVYDPRRDRPRASRTAPGDVHFRYPPSMVYGQAPRDPSGGPR